MKLRAWYWLAANVCGQLFVTGASSVLAATPTTKE
jgi:hypothetical protein